MADAKELQTIFERTAEAVALKPAVGQGTAATMTRLRDGMTCDIEEGQWQTTADLGPELGGNNEGPGAGFLLRGALGTCILQTAALWAAKLGVPIDHLEIEVETDTDARGLFGVGNVPPRYPELRYRVTVESTAPEEDVRRVLDAAHAHSMTRDALEHAYTVERDMRITAPATRPRQPLPR